jgi:7,8-dihydropterin-6-yl-methyl-4-(beta-D-ribofuranosyl)aminobenzene 5'-phosphate synthase
VRPGEYKEVMMNETNRHELREVDSVEVHVLVDNANGVMHEWGYLKSQGNFVLSGEAICCAAFGLSLVITAKMGDITRVLLFDAGPEEATFGRNSERLGINLGSVNAVVLSHGHWDHAGGLLEAIRRIFDGNGGQQVECHVNAGMFVSRAMRAPDGDHIRFKDVPDPAALNAAGARVVNSPDARSVLDGFFHLSGEIPRTTSFENGIPSHRKLSSDGTTWEPDPMILDERYVAVHIRGLGIIIFTACSHAGIINILRDARERFRGLPLYGLMGGFHLSGKGPESAISQTVEELKSFGLRRVMPGHCTGWRAMSAFSSDLEPDVLVPLAVGRKFHFEGV